MGRRVIRCLVLVLAVSFASTNAKAQSSFWVGLTDKAGSPYSVSRPGEFLSARAIERRTRQGIPIDGYDLPVNRVYLDTLLQAGAELLHSSKWLNGVTVRLPSDTLAGEISRFRFVREVVCTRPSPSPAKSAGGKFGFYGQENPIDSSFYGLAVHQVAMLKGQVLHQAGYRGEGMVIAILDAGFSQADTLALFDSLRMEGRLLGTRDFVNPSSRIFREHPHGMMVFSTMAGNLPGKIVGTAPEASYWLLRTEDAPTEYPVEEDYWVAGAEFADSAGADIINSSLGYSVFDLATMNHTYGEMDGKTTRVTRGANMAASRGMLVFVSAGNEGNKAWRHITAPADGDSVIAVGAVDKEGIRASFSSTGPSADGDVKPDLAAMGLGTAVSSTDGQVVANNGTSFSSPILAGMAACLWQAHPKATAPQIRKALILSGNLIQNPDSLLGYGIPDMQLASLLLQKSTPADLRPLNTWQVFPNPFTSQISILHSGTNEGGFIVRLYSSAGTLVIEKKFTGMGLHRLALPGDLPFGLWLLEIATGSGREIHKLTGGKTR